MTRNPSPPQASSSPSPLDERAQSIMRAWFETGTPPLGEDAEYLLAQITPARVTKNPPIAIFVVYLPS